MPSTRPTNIQQQRALVALTALRVVVGGVFAVHGWAKLTDIAGTAQSFQSLGMPAPQAMVYLAIAGELFGGVGLALGFLTRVAALGPVCTMLVAIITVHAGHGLLAKNGGFEYPMVLFFASAFFAVNGAGRLSVDAALERRVAISARRPPRMRMQIPSQPL